jgi:hypothetical protein
MRTIYHCVYDNCHVNYESSGKLHHHTLFSHRFCSLCKVGLDADESEEQHVTEKRHVLCNQCPSLLLNNQKSTTHIRTHHQNHANVLNRASNTNTIILRAGETFVCGCGKNYQFPQSFVRHHNSCDIGNPAAPEEERNEVEPQGRRGRDEDESSEGSPHR